MFRLRNVSHWCWPPVQMPLTCPLGLVQLKCRHLGEWIHIGYRHTADFVILNTEQSTTQYWTPNLTTDDGSDGEIITNFCDLSDGWLVVSLCPRGTWPSLPTVFVPLFCDVQECVLRGFWKTFLRVIEKSLPDLCIQARTHELKQVSKKKASSPVCSKSILLWDWTFLWCFASAPGILNQSCYEVEHFCSLLQVLLASQMFLSTENQAKLT